MGLSADGLLCLRENKPGAIKVWIIIKCKKIFYQNNKIFSKSAQKDFVCLQRLLMDWNHNLA